MQSSTTAWHREWTIDPDPLAAAQARHRPSGFGVNLKTLAMVKVRAGEGPYVAAIYSDDSRPVIDRLFDELGTRGCRAWIEEKQSQARDLWHALGLDVDPSATLTAPLPCDVACWRDLWTIQCRQGIGQVDLLHASGWATRFVYNEVGADGRIGWCGIVPDAWASQVTAAESALGEQSTVRLKQEAEILLMEEGYFDCSPEQQARPFGDAWRTLWHVQEKEREQWLVHVSGLAVSPHYGTVDDDGLQGWSLTMQSWDVHELNFAMRRRVGDKAWDRIHDQAWTLCVEMGYVVPPGETVH